MFKRENIEKIVRLIPRPTMKGKAIAPSHNSWLVLNTYNDQGEGIEILHKITNHSGKIPFDHIREWREPDMIILSSQLNLGKDGLFDLCPFHNGPETEILVEAEAFRPERLTFVKSKLKRVSQQETQVLRKLVIQGRTPADEILRWYLEMGMAPDSLTMLNSFEILSNETQLIEKDNPNKLMFVAWIKQEFVPILEQLLLSTPSKESSADR